MYHKIHITIAKSGAPCHIETRKQKLLLQVDSR